MITYAQNYEDVTLMRALRSHGPGFYIDVGAGHPQEHSVTKAFYDIGWHGINVEPGLTEYALLCQERPRDTNLCCCAGAQDGEDYFDIYPNVNDCLNAARKSLRERFAQDGHKPETKLFKTFTLDTIIEDHAPGEIIHFLKVDVEGYERQVLEGLSLAKHAPWVIVVEATYPHTQVRCDYQWNNLLFVYGYTEVHFDGLNCFYLHPGHENLQEALSLPPNIFDEFTRA